ncbi:MAG: tetratricopeptide repeat protein, partial [Myxococcaceae bacterium]
FLALTGGVAFSKTPVAADANAPFASADVIAPRKRKSLPAETLAELRDAAVKIITSSYFRMLGLDISADSEAVERAYHEVATRFHADSYADFDTSEIKDLLDSVQDKLSASYRVLSVEEKRKAYLQYLLSRLDVPRSASLNVDAEINLKRGEAALKRGDPRSAMGAFEEAVSLNPREPEYYCYLAWATYLAAKGEPKDRAKAAQKLLRKALGLNPYLERATIISAIIDGESGDTAGARKRLLKVLEMNPSSKLAKAALRKVGR